MSVKHIYCIIIQTIQVAYKYNNHNFIQMLNLIG